ncbi:hypothetical protein LTR95_016258 [Oleoguttula sp. CCFEE 5521]
MNETTIEDVTDGLHGRILHDFYRLTEEEHQPADIVLDQFRMLFHRAIRTLEEQARQRTTNAIVFHYGDQANSHELSNEWSVFLDPQPDEHGVLFDLASPNSPILPGALQHSPGHLSPISDEPSLEACVPQSPSQRRRSYEKATSVSKIARVLDQALAVSARALDIHDSLSKRLNNTGVRVSSLTYMSVLFGSPRTVQEFIELLPSIFGSNDVRLPDVQASTGTIMISIDRVERGSSAFNVLRRIRLAQLRQVFENCVTVFNCGPERSRKALRPSNVLDRMTDDWIKESQETIHITHGDEWFRRRKSLQNRLSAARLWYRIFSTYSTGGLALFTTEIRTSMYTYPPASKAGVS